MIEPFPRTDHKGRATTRFKRHPRTRPDGPFIQHQTDMLNSPAHRQLSLAARLILDRLEIEHGNHGGNENGRLPCTFVDFVDFGVHRNSVAPALRELEALGFLRITRGTAGNAEFRRASRYTITYLPVGNEAATHDWRKVQDAETARVVAMEAREAKEVAPPRLRRGRAIA